MLTSTSKKIAALILAITCSAAFAYPPPFYFCNKECIKVAPRGSAAWQECMADCLDGYPE
ncbi:hypothetical protein [Undibacterium sp. TS12]|uniref:hypothetical protein n=1 Tax=Undibacterium sp. TS12 TaxID=2908202 RepID=UPI001F4CC308|nr:hypothetical protein [Undibacterium sp. TS12]MCH8618276.1 hypothetical protein [Undibacterium sp. TS12]